MHSAARGYWYGTAVGTFDGGRDGIRLDPNGYAPQSHALMPALSKNSKIVPTGIKPVQERPELVRNDQPVGRPSPSLLRIAHATGGHIMIDTPHQDKGLHNANVSDFDAALNLVHYGPNLRNYDISYVQWSESDAHGRRLAKSLHSDIPRDATIRRLIDANVVGICLWDLNGQVLEANDAFLSMLQYEHEDVASGRLRWTDLTPAEVRNRDERALAELRSTGTFQPFEKEYFRKDGRRMPVLIGGALFEESGNEGVAFVLDLTERKRAQEEHAGLRQLESDLAHLNRLSIMGELTASLAHEILHPIATARNNAQVGMRFLQMRPPNLDGAREALSCIVRDADRAKDIVGRMRDHIKKAPPRRECFDLNGAINEVIGLARNVIIRNGVSVQARLAHGLLSVHGDRVQVQQVILNLVLNAVEAMGSVDAGARELLISTEQDHTGVLVAVRDSGPGIDPAHLERVFEAFYTTRSSGLGMGLSICRSIIDAHGGRLWAEANEPRGAAFQFTLPAAQDGS